MSWYYAKKLVTLSSRDFLQEILQIFNVSENIFVSNMFWINIAVIRAHFLHEFQFSRINES